MMSPARIKEARDLLHLMTNKAQTIDGYFACAEHALTEDRHRLNRKLAREQVGLMILAIQSLRSLVVGEEIAGKLELSSSEQT